MIGKTPAESVDDALRGKIEELFPPIVAKNPEIDPWTAACRGIGIDKQTAPPGNPDQSPFGNQIAAGGLHGRPGGMEMFRQSDFPQRDRFAGTGLSYQYTVDVAPDQQLYFPSSVH